MDQEKIGKFICKCRKEKNMTQANLAERIGVTEKSVSNWENGRNMPDLSLFKPLCSELGITINDLMSGEKIKKEEYQEKLEENIENTISYTSKKVNGKNNLIGVILIIFGILLTLTAMSIFPSDSSWGSIYSIFGCIISLIGVSRFTKRLSYGKRLICNFSYFIFFVLVLFAIDYVGVIFIHQAPRFALEKTAINNMMIYKTPFYNVYKINGDSKNEYYIVDKDKVYSKDNVPVSPFNRQKSGIDNIIKYKNNYVGNNANDGELISSLPLSEYGYVFEIDSNDLGLSINYNISDWYINDNSYLKQALIYNSVSIFSLIDNVDYVTFNFSGKSYNVTRNEIQENYPNFNEIIKDGVNKEAFNKYLENKMNDIGFVKDIFDNLFSE